MRKAIYYDRPASKKMFVLLVEGFSLLCLLLSGHAWALPVGNLTAVWANEGEDKVTRNELRATLGANVNTQAWDGTKISIFGARNEVVAFNLILEAGGAAAGNVTVSFNRLTGPAGATLTSTPATGSGVFDWTRRNIELFYVRYLQIKGLSIFGYENRYDERHVPIRLRRPWTGNGVGSGGWANRPDHDKFYPEIAVPLELVPSFNIAAGQNQSIWVDVYIPQGKPAGLYQGSVLIQQNGGSPQTIPVQLTVYGFTLPNTPSAKTMLYYSSPNINQRYLGSTYVSPASAAGIKSRLLKDRHYMVAHRHRFSLIGDDPGDCDSTADQPCPESAARLNGSLFTAANGYDGPGVGVGNNVYSIGTYGGWSWKTGTQADMWRHTDAWAAWFNQNSPTTEYFLYLIDESNDFPQIENWARWILANPGPGRQVKSLATLSLLTAAHNTPSLDIPTSAAGIGITSQWQPVATAYTSDPRKRFFQYNTGRPYTGSTATEDDGVSLRVRAWTQYKKRIQRWFFWETTYYNNFQGGTGQLNVFRNAMTFGGISSVDAVIGETGALYSNGDGVLLYPGTDLLFPADSYGVDGPFASLRLKYWRRGLQDVDYLTMAAAINPAAVTTLVNQMIPKVLWEYGVDSQTDPTYVHTDISWSTDPQVWEAARAQLAGILAGMTGSPSITSPSTAAGTVGTAFSYTIAASNNPTSFNATGLPAGLSVNTGTGLISGTPTAAGTSNVTLSATNAGGTGTRPLTITLTTTVLTRPAITSGITAAGAVGTAFSYRITASNNPASFNATGLPAGLSVNTGTGLITGTPTAAGTSIVTMSATNVSGTGTTLLTITVTLVPARPVITSGVTATGAVGTAFSYRITASNNPASFNATGLPAGLSVNTGTGLISGTPTAAGTSIVTMSATNASGTGTTLLTLTRTTVLTRPVITSGVTAAGAVGTAFSYRIMASNNPASFNATGLPAGLSVNTGTGLISGTPTAAGTSIVTMSATNLSGTGTTLLTLTLTATSPPSTQQVLQTPSLDLPPTLPVDGTVTLGYPSGYPDISFQWTITAASGMSAAPSRNPVARSPAGPAIFRTPSRSSSLGSYSLTPGYYLFTVEAFDSLGNSSPATQAYVTLVLAEGSDVRVFPNPSRAGAPMTFDQLPAGSLIKIFTVSGRWVRTLTSENNSAGWDMTNADGTKVASGLYVYLISRADGSGSIVRGKLVVIK